MSKLSSAQRWWNFSGNHAFQPCWGSLSYSFTTLRCLLPFLIFFYLNHTAVNHLILFLCSGPWSKKVLTETAKVMSPTHQSFVLLWARSFCQPIFIFDAGCCTCLTNLCQLNVFLKSTEKTHRSDIDQHAPEAQKSPVLHCKQQQIVTCAPFK